MEGAMGRGREERGKRRVRVQGGMYTQEIREGG